MPNESLALPDILAGLPNEADYDAVYAAVMATERGRRFLTEYANRNRHADTQMLVGAIARVEAVICGDPSPHAPAVLVRDLIEIAAAIDRIEVEIATGKTQASDVLGAVERIQDIAFVLHERPVEATLCDALDAAIREISDAFAHSNSTAESARKATELLHALASRVGEIIAGRGAALPGTENSATGSVEAKPGAGSEDVALLGGVIDSAAPPRPGRSEPEAEHDENLAGALAALAASLPPLADAPQPAFDAQSESGDAVSLPSVRADKSEQPSGEAENGEDAAARGTEAATMDDISASTDGEEAADERTSSQTSLSEETLSEETLSQVPSNGHFSSADLSSKDPTSDMKPNGETLSEEPPSEGPLPSQNYSTEAVAGPEEDPGDLFEALPVPSPLVALAVETTAPTVMAGAPMEIPPPAAPQSAPPRVAAAPASRAIPRPAASDPLAAVRALSEEELIALFS
jgi:hypothetical protein